MAQSLLPLNYEIDPTQSKCTTLGGLPLFLDLMSSLGLFTALRQCLDGHWETKGWSLSDVVPALVLVNLAGGECVEDVERLDSDVGFSKVMELANQSGYSRQHRRYLQRKLAKLSVRKFPSSSSVFRRLELFHDVQEEEEKERRRQEAIRTSSRGKAYVQKSNPRLKGLLAVNKRLVAAVQQRSVQKEATPCWAPTPAVREISAL